MIRYRKPESVMKRIDILLRRNGEVLLDHGIGGYWFDHYEYEEANWENKYKSQLRVFYRDYDKTVKLYMVLTEDNLRKPTKDDLFVYLVDCSWEKEFPRLLNMKQYHI